jgi:putative ABC transport system permease protein
MGLLHPKIWQLGMKSLWLHPLRSMLTVLGIFIGVASVVWLLAIGEGISQEAQRQIQQLGATNIILRSVLPAEDTMSNDAFYVNYGIKREDVRALERIPTIKNAVRIRETYREAHAGAVTLASHLVGCTAEYAELMQMEVESGRFISDVDVANKENVCVLAAGTANKFFPTQNPLGQAIRIREIPYVIVGVMKPRTPMAGIGSSLAAQDFTTDVYIPLETFWQRIGDQVLFVQAGQRSGEEIQLSQITIQVDSPQDVLPTAEAIRRTMSILHEKMDYALVVPLELLERARTTRLMFMVFMGLIAAVTLIVGGIGIMNIMLATVTERTREIGIRRALGAKRRDITSQFLAEAVVLSSVGGLTGIAGGLTCPWVFEAVRRLLLTSMPEAMGNLPPSIQSLAPQIVSWSIPLAFAIAVITGVCFGIYPAIRAAHMDPIEALRHE